eukprot:GFUD01040580.1.p1 GENE.GFUD01040580.1~~GFUD01040580.1.p1  ORF type:complete len:104 (+),score=23.70 GFUD01040580.1:148-459(+)
MENFENNQKVWTLNTTVWQWELETYFNNKMTEDGFVQDLLILAVIAGVILVLIFIFAIQISRSYFKSSSSTSNNISSFQAPSSDPFSEKVPDYADVVLEMALQ